ncbi:MAG: hypothetical protein AAB654_04585 [Acidobacteriota bacterium]
MAEVARFDDELFAYFMFNHLRGEPALRQTEVLLAYETAGPRAEYPVFLHLENDLLTALPFVLRLRADRLVSDIAWRFVEQETLDIKRQQSRVFDAAYSLPIRRKLEGMTASELTAYMRRFVRFKSATDLRVRKQLEPVPPALSRQDAHRLASDIITVARFFALPLDFFLGIGAMENNYMNVKGDLGHAVWKKRAEKGDVILRRRRGRVLVLNESSGVWQITRETLRYAHRLYMRDRRDYSVLPEHLRPPRELDLDEVPPEALTTYAGVLFRDLLDRFDGDVVKAVGAYNGGPGNPDLQYAAGVEAIASHARKAMEHAAALHGRSVAEIRFITSPRR